MLVITACTAFGSCQAFSLKSSLVCPQQQIIVMTLTDEHDVVQMQSLHLPTTVVAGRHCGSEAKDAMHDDV